MTPEQLKNSLIATGCFEANEYLTQYVELCINNINAPKQKGQTNKHHTIPLAYYIKEYNLQNRHEAEHFARCDKNNFIVNLLFKDHILAHYYLSLCATDIFKYKAICALNYLLGNSKKIYNLDTLQAIADELDLTKYQELYETHAKLNATVHTGKKQNRTAEWNEKISKSNVGKIKINKDGVEKAVNVNELEKYLELGWANGIIPYTAERKEQARKNALKATDVARLKNTGENNPAKRPEVKAKISNALKGKSPSAETRAKISKTKTGKQNPKNAKQVTIAGITYYSRTVAMKELQISRKKLLEIMEVEQNENTN